MSQIIEISEDLTKETCTLSMSARRSNFNQDLISNYWKEIFKEADSNRKKKALEEIIVIPGHSLRFVDYFQSWSLHLIDGNIEGIYLNIHQHLHDCGIIKEYKDRISGDEIDQNYLVKIPLTEIVSMTFEKL